MNQSRYFSALCQGTARPFGSAQIQKSNSIRGNYWAALFALILMTSFISVTAMGQASHVPLWTSPTAPTTDVPVSADYDGDGKADLAFWRPSDGNWRVLRSSDGVLQIQQWGLPGDIPVPADYDKDGKIDFAIWRPSDGNWWVLKSSTGTYQVQQWGLPGDIPVPGDYDKDGKTDYAIWRPSGGNWWVLKSSTGAYQIQQWGLPGDIPVPGDYDGDGKTDYAIWRSSDGKWWVLKSTTGAYQVQQWGVPGDIPVPDDYDGDGKTDLAIWRPSDGNWWVLKSSTGAYQVRPWGLPSDTPMPADYDGDGKVDIAIWRRSDANWYIVNSSNGATSVRAISLITFPDAARLAEQATFGPTDSLVAHIQSVGAQSFLNEQFAAPSSTYQNFPYYPGTSPPECSYDSANPNGPASICNRDNYSLFQVQLRFFQNAMTGQDQLRQRVAFALSQVMVVSGNELNQAYSMAPYQQLLRNDAFGNFRQLLEDVTLSPAMGRYLDMVNNDKPDPTRGTEPNENYGRELLQLFSIGKYKLNQDGTTQLDGQGKPIPAYDQETVEGFAHVFTGWTYPTQPNATPVKHNPTYYIGPMVVYASNHDTGAKELLDGYTIPAGQSAATDLTLALNNIFNHPNVGPFIGKQLIQHLVTSNPSPAYVARVAAVFNANAQGVRGDLKSVVQAILLDPEARGDSKTAVEYGHLREPVLFVLNAIRGFGGQSDGVYLRGQVSGMGQNLFYSPSVFNYYPPDYDLPGAQLLAPEFAIMNTASAFSRANFINSLLYTTNGIAPDPNVSGSTGTSINLSSLQALTGNPTQLVDQLNASLMHGTMSAQMKNAIITAVQAVTATDTLGRARAAAYLVATSSQYQVER